MTTPLTITVGALHVKGSTGAGPPAVMDPWEPALSEADGALYVANHAGAPVPFDCRANVASQIAAAIEQQFVLTGGTRVTLENRSGSPLPAGTAVMTHSSGGGMEPYDGVRPMIGVTVAAIAAATSGEVQTAGPLKLSWTLSPARRYYADPLTPGALTSTAPTAEGQIVQEVGLAVVSDILEIHIGPEITL